MLKQDEFPENFILDITSMPGSSDDITLYAIDYYQKQLDNPNLIEPLRDIARAYIVNLTAYYEMSNFDSQKLRDALPHLSETAIFMENKTCIDMDVESTARIKSLYSTYQKILDRVFEYVANNKPIPDTEFLKDIYATRDIFHPRHDMKIDPQAFYRLVYRTILEYMEYIDDIHSKDPNYSFIEVSKQDKKDLKRPKKITYSKVAQIDIPEKDFITYALEARGIPQAYKYLAELPDNLSSETIANEIINLQNCDISDETSYSSSLIFNMIVSQTKKEFSNKLRNHFEELLIKDLSKDVLADYSSLPIEEFLEHYRSSLNSFQLNSCMLIHHLDCAEAQGTFENEVLPKFTNIGFINNLTETLNEYNILQRTTILEKINAIKNLDISSSGLPTFYSNLEKARRIKYYDICSKDYMKNPKGNGYQSFHIGIKTPFGFYEKQIRTNKQHIFAEKGPASHTLNYKPDVRNTFHRLKVPAPLSPKRDSNGELITPTELGVLPFDTSVSLYYGTSFSTFADGKTFEEFKAQFETKEAFDQALFDLSPKDTNFVKKLINKIFTKRSKPTIKVNPELASSSIVMPEIPKDIAVYVQRPSGGTSTDDSDPHDSR